MSENGGLRASKRGRVFETDVKTSLKDYGYREVFPVELFSAMKIMDQKLFCCQVDVGKDTYNNKKRCDLLMYNPISGH